MTSEGINGDCQTSFVKHLPALSAKLRPVDTNLANSHNMSSANEPICIAITSSRRSDNETLRTRGPKDVESMGTDNERLSFRMFEQAVQSATGISVPQLKEENGL
ncbi:hypothetical protein V865_002781 [Kwoniella europaea PYCC6329]|uniref:Uncharacterized protein n=1 Tax=Kwoniella europaea PYCC6329 TaxID=1423913 RepID=A0AAX4KGL0_9TREE